MHVTALAFCLFAILSHVDATLKRNLKGKVTIVTGAARGIGRAIADNLLQEKVEVVIIVDKNLTQGLVTEVELKCKYKPEQVWFIHGDVTTDLDRVFKEISTRYEYIDILVNNAGILNEDDPVLTIRTNLVAPVLWSRKYYNIMRKDQGGKGGIILNIVSIEAYTKDPFFRFYKTSKFGLLGLSVGLGHEWNYLRSGVKVIALCPSLTYTEMARQAEGGGEPQELEIIAKYMQSFQGQSPDAVGQAAITLFRTGKTGTAYTIAAGELSLSPYGEEVTVEFLRSL